MVNVNEIKLNICNQNLDIFVYDGFFNWNTTSSPFHCHDYAEIHFTVSGECLLYTDKQELISEAGTVTIIPSGVIHRLKMTDGATRHNAFLVKSSTNALIQKKVPCEILETFIEELDHYRSSGDFGNAAISIAYLCKDILKPEVKPSNIENREFIIREFFANRYSENVTISELSEELKLSPKHTARMVEKYMGMPFSKVLAKHRMDAAKLFLKTDKSLTLTEIARMVGYDSYSGFWKSFKKISRS